ncbi:MAG: hypothetical protein IJB97_06475 [Clostridia bacterium]|nr:hypothetical protein [Clostridia bacterium]
MRKFLIVVFCFIICFFSFSFFTACDRDIVAIYTKNNGIIRPINIYKTGKSTIEGWSSGNTLDVDIRYKYYCQNPQYSPRYPNGSGYYCVYGLIDYSKNGWDYTSYWGKDEAVLYDTELSFSKTLYIKLREKRNTYKITYYDLDEKCLNDISKKNLKRFKKVIELNKSEITKIDYSS